MLTDFTEEWTTAAVILKGGSFCAVILACSGSVVAGQTFVGGSDPLRLSREERPGFARERYPRGRNPGYLRLQALRRMDRMIQERDALGQPSPVWTSIGPRPTLEGRYHWSAWTNAIAVDPGDPETVYIGNPGSGVWKTTNGGMNWVPTGDQEASLGIGSIAVAPSNPNVVYAGTGYWDVGVGVLKSTDKAGSWTLFSGPFAGPFGPNEFWNGGYFIFQIAVHPTNPDIVLAGVFRGDVSKAGVYRSADGGVSWKQVLSGGRGSGLAFDPNSPNTVYAAIGEYYGPSHNGFYKSTDAGISWTPINNGITSLLPMSSEIRLTLSGGTSPPTRPRHSAPGFDKDNWPDTIGSSARTSSSR
jgi:hypothetical protein